MLMLDVLQGPDRGMKYGLPDNEPQLIGRYRVEKLLGKGGFGLVYLARDTQLDRLVAVKVPHSRNISRPDDVKIYLDEARTVASLDHPHIVPVHDVGSTPEFPCYIVSKFVDGASLGALIRKGRFSFTIAAEMIATDVGLGYMLFLARDFYRTEVIILGMVVVGTLWLLLDRLVLAPWERATIERWGMVRAA